MAGGTIGTPVITATTTYALITDGDVYFQNLMYADAWTDADDTDKSKALSTATLIIDSLSYNDDKYDDDQALEFPRGTDTTYPQAIINACCEIALSLLEGYNPDMTLRTTEIKSTNFDSVSTTYDRGSIPEYITLGIPSVRAWRLLRPYINFNQGITISRVN